MTTKEQEFQTEQISILFRKYFFPTLMGMLAISMVTMIDGIFVGQGVGADGVAAVNIVWAPMMLLVGLGIMLGMGVGVTASVAMAQGKMIVARRHVTLGLAAGVVITGVVISVMLANPQGTARVLGASGTLMQMTTDYMLFLLPGFLFSICCTVGQFALRSAGNPQTAMWATLFPAVVNFVLDWWLIFPMDMGVKGAAIATALSYVSGAIIVICALCSPRCTLRLMPVFKKVTWEGGTRYVLSQCKIGLSGMLGELVMALTMFLGNVTTIRMLGDAGVGAFGVVCYYLPFVFLIGNAIAQGAQPIVSYNYGCGNGRQLAEARHCMAKTAAICGIVVASLFFFGGKPLTALYIPIDSEAGIIAVEAFPYYAFCTIPYIINIAGIGYLQSVGKVVPSVLFALLRGTVFLIPAFLLLPSLIGKEGIWLALSVSEIATTCIIVGYFMTKRL